MSQQTSHQTNPEIATQFIDFVDAHCVDGLNIPDYSTRHGYYDIFSPDQLVPIDGVDFAIHHQREKHTWSSYTIYLAGRAGLVLFMNYCDTTGFSMNTSGHHSDSSIEDNNPLITNLLASLSAHEALGLMVPRTNKRK